MSAGLTQCRVGICSTAPAAGKTEVRKNMVALLACFPELCSVTVFLGAGTNGLSFFQLLLPLPLLVRRLLFFLFLALYRVPKRSAKVFT
jgi:hypothetical protein